MPPQAPARTVPELLPRRRRGGLLAGNNEGAIDLRGFLGLAPDVPKDNSEIRANFMMKVRPEDLPRIPELAAFSPVFSTITNGARMAVQKQGS